MRVLLATALVALLLPAVAQAARSAVLVDCNRNSGVVGKRFSVGKLRAAYRAIPKQKRVSSDCGQSIASHLAALRGLKGGRLAGDVLEDCTRHGGRLTQKFAPHALSRAARLMTAWRREQTRCLIGILSQLRARGRAVAISKPGKQKVGGPFDDQTGAELRESLKPTTEALRRFQDASDGLPQNIFDLIERRNARGEGLDILSVRRVGPGETPVWLITANGRMCGIRWYGDTIRPDYRCVAANRWAKGQAMLQVRPHSDATYDVWGVAPDMFENARLLFGDGDRSRALVTAGNGVLDELEQIPGAVEWEADGGRQWFDTTTKPCLANCLSVPPVAGIS